MVVRLVSVRPQMIDFGSGQGLNDFETGGIACCFEDFKIEKTPPRADGTSRAPYRKKTLFQTFYETINIYDKIMKERRIINEHSIFWA